MKWNFRYISQNYTPQNRAKKDILFLVIHDTGNRDSSATADMHFQYFNSSYVGASADIFVDDKQILQVNDWFKRYTWHIGDDKDNTNDESRNYNSIGIELCINRGIDTAKAYNNLLQCVSQLQREFPHAKVIRHYDDSQKLCPQSWYDNGKWTQWYKFLEDLKGGVGMFIDDQELTAKIQKESASIAKQILEKDYGVTMHSSDWAKSMEQLGRELGYAESKHQPQEILQWVVLMAVMKNFEDKISGLIEAKLKDMINSDRINLIISQAVGKDGKNV